MDAVLCLIPSTHQQFTGERSFIRTLDFWAVRSICRLQGFSDASINKILRPLLGLMPSNLLRFHLQQRCAFN